MLVGPKSGKDKVICSGGRFGRLWCPPTAPPWAGAGQCQLGSRLSYSLEVLTMRPVTDGVEVWRGWWWEESSGGGDKASWRHFDFGKSGLGMCFDLERERFPALSQRTQSLDTFWCYAQKCWNILFSCPVSDLVCLVLAVYVVNSQFYIRSSCNTLSNQLLHFLFIFFLPQSHLGLYEANQ